MNFIKDSWNVKIFLLVVLVAVSMVSLLLVFQRNFKDINVRYHTKLDELNATFEQLTGAQAQLNNTIEDLQLQNLKESDLREKYVQLRTQKDALEIERNNLRTDVANKTNQINLLNVQISSLQSQINDLNARISRLQDENTRLSTQVSCLRSGNTNC